MRDLALEANLGMTRIHDTEGPGSSAGGGEGGDGYFYEQDPTKMFTKDLLVRTVKALTAKDPDENDDDNDDVE